MKKIGKKRIIILVIALILIIGLGSLYAYLTSTDHKTNVFTLGSVKITLTETNWNPSNAQDTLPGDSISKDPKINNVGKNPAYVYIKVVNPIVELTSSTGPLFSYTVNSGWTQLAQEEQCGYRATTYYYNTALNQNASTTTLFNSVTINDYEGEMGEEQLLDVYGYGIQSSYLESGSTITSIFTSNFTTSLTDTDKSCRSGLDCSNNPVYTTVPNNLKGLAKIMAENAYLDNAKSEFVNSCSGVDFSTVSSNANGKGIYEIASTKNDTYPIYYYRGAVDNNNVKFAGFCWKAIRTTDTGGVKLIYNGEPDGSGNCTNTTGTSTQIGTSAFNSSHTSPSDVGYMYGTRYTYSSKSSSNLATAYIYGKDVTYSGGTYTLTNTMTSTGTWSTDYNTLNNNHYTCFTTGTMCTSVYYIYYTTRSTANYITLTNGKKVEDALDEMFVNTTDSAAKTTIDNWYNTNLSSYTSYIEDTIYCNDRSISQLNGWDLDGGDTTNNLYFSSYTRAWTSHSPNLACSRALDRFTVSSTKGNGALTYPVGLITIDEIMYAGGKNGTGNSTYYLYTNLVYWSLSPRVFLYYLNLTSLSAMVFNVYSDGNNNDGSVIINIGIRPVISLKSTDVVQSGDGTTTNPYVIQTN